MMHVHAANWEYHQNDYNSLSDGKITVVMQASIVHLMYTPLALIPVRIMARFYRKFGSLSPTQGASNFFWNYLMNT